MVNKCFDALQMPQILILQSLSPQESDFQDFIPFYPGTSHNVSVYLIIGVSFISSLFMQL